MTDAIPLAGVIGHPVAHSRSPRLHGHWLQRHGLAGHYVPLDVAPADLERVLAALPRAGFVGANVTIPHKHAALALADRSTDRARRVGAANTLVFRDGGIEADTTDGEGFLENLRQGAPGWSAGDGPVAVLGAGGASRGIIDALLDAGTPEVRLSNRTTARADALADLFGSRVTVVPWRDAEAMFDGAAAAVNTTSLGMQGQPPLEISLAGLPRTAVVTDIVYAPLVTPFLAAASSRGLRCVDGLGMLLHQAVPGFERWFGHRPVVDAALRCAVLAP